MSGTDGQTGRTHAATVTAIRFGRSRRLLVTAYTESTAHRISIASNLKRACQFFGADIQKKSTLTFFSTTMRA